MQKPIIAVNSEYRNATKDSPAFSYLASGYYDAVHRAGGVPIVLPPLVDEDDLTRLIATIDGVLFVGGGDLDPRRDGWMMHPSIRPLSQRREEFDRMLMRIVSEQRVPVFAIGAGMQLLNVSQGGNLMLHIPEDRPDALPHRDAMDPAHRHGLDVVSGTIMDRVFGEGEIRVNSMHHMAVDEVAPGFEVSARCPDGIIESIESVMPDWAAFGTQFHPEAESASAIDIRIFEEFIENVRQCREAACSAAADDLRLVA